MKRNQETLPVRDLRVIASQDFDLMDRVAEFLGDDWGDVGDREVLITYPEHNRMKRIDSETSFHWND